jgi:hypothetical protein
VDGTGAPHLQKVLPRIRIPCILHRRLHLLPISFIGWRWW